MNYAEKRKQIDELKVTLDSLLPMSLEDERRFWKKIRLEWNYNSNHIEGNTLTYGETELLLIFDQTGGSHELREYQEMKAHDVAIHMVKEWAKDKSRDITESDIRELNKIILVTPYWKEAVTKDRQPTRRQIKVGEYKEQPNSVILQNGETFEYASPLETPVKMKELMDFYRIHSVSTEVHPVWLAAMIHHKFSLIHPFDDGNGRVARLVMNYILMKNDFPPILIKSSEKKKYLEALRQADVGNDQFFEFYLYEQLEKSFTLAIKAAKGESIEEPEDLDKKLAMLKMEIADVDTDNEVQLQFNRETFFKIYDTWLSDLIKGLVVKIKKFDDLFVKPSHYILIQNRGRSTFGGGSSMTIQFEGKNENEIIEKIKSEITANNSLIMSEATIAVHATYGTFKKGALKNPFGCNYNVDVYFDYLKYEIYRRKFIASLHHYPHFNDELKNTLRMQTNIKMVYFDASGNHYFNVHKGEDGILFSNTGEHIKMLLSYSAEDILNNKIIDGGMECFAEPRLLHKSFTKTEIDTLCNEFGETIYNHIDYCTKQAGLR